MKKTVILIFLISAFSIESFGQQNDTVKVLPGEGIVYNNDTILLNKTSISELHQKLRIIDMNPDEYRVYNVDGWDSETWEGVSWIEYNREIEYKSIVFSFIDENDKDNIYSKLTLWIMVWNLSA